MRTHNDQETHITLPPDQYGQIQNLEVCVEKAEVGIGLSEKSFRQDAQGAKYIVKNPKSRTLGEIFSGVVPQEIALYIEKYKGIKFETRDYIAEEDCAMLAPYIQHLQDILIESALGEVIFSTVSGALFPASLASPETCLHIDPKTGVPQVLSKLLSNFNEFLDKKVQALLPADEQNPSSPDYWAGKTRPSREMLHLSAQENYLLGKLFAVALLSDDWDLLNNISLANAGCIGKTAEATKIAVVDGGNKFHFGFGGVTKSETSFKNAAISDVPITPENALKCSDPVKGFVATLPFDHAVYPHLPRQLVDGLFDVENPDLFRGFKEAILEARAAYTENPECIQQAIDHAFQRISLNSDPKIVAALRNHDPKTGAVNILHAFYAPSAQPDQAKEAKAETDFKPYTLNNMLVGRLASLEKMCAEIEAEKSLNGIAQEVVTQYKEAQIAGTKKEHPPVIPPDMQRLSFLNAMCIQVVTVRTEGVAEVSKEIPKPATPPAPGSLSAATFARTERDAEKAAPQSFLLQAMELQLH